MADKADLRFMLFDVFISYSRKDKAIADRICAAFEDAGISYFIDRHSLSGGMEITDTLAQAILDSDVFLFIGSQSSYQSKFTNSEVIWAFNKKEKNHIVPYVIDDTEMPNGLQFAFGGINIRNLREHPIEPTLVDDILFILKKKRLSHQPSPSMTESAPFNPTPLTESRTDEETGPIYDQESVDRAPLFGIGNPDSFYVWLKDQLKQVSSTMAYHQKRFSCIVEFVVRKDGCVTDVHSKSEEEPTKKVLEIIRRSPKWLPGVKDRVPVAVRMTAWAKMEFDHIIPKKG